MSELFQTSDIAGYSINSVALTTGFIVLCYLFFVVLLIIAASYFYLHRESLFSAIRKAVIVAFCGTGLLYTINTTISWGHWVYNDWDRLSGLTTEGKLDKIDGNIYRVASFIKTVIKDRYYMPRSGKLEGYKVEYYLSPSRNVEDAQYIVVMQGRVSYNALKKELVWDNKIYENVEPIEELETAGLETLALVFKRL
jgi:hypothetical protein